VELRYTLDGALPTSSSPVVTGPITLARTSTVTARCFREGKPVSGPASATFTRVRPSPGVAVTALEPGVSYAYYQGEWDVLPDFSKLEPVKRGGTASFDLDARTREEYFGLDFNGFVKVPEDGVYAFSTDSDDGSRLFVDGTLLVDNDGLHGRKEVSGVVALAAGYHAVRVQYFQKTGGRELAVSVEGPTGTRQAPPASWLFRRK